MEEREVVLSALKKKRKKERKKGRETRGELALLTLRVPTILERKKYV